MSCGYNPCSKPPEYTCGCIGQDQFFCNSHILEHLEIKTKHSAVKIESSTNPEGFKAVKIWLRKMVLEVIELEKKVVTEMTGIIEILQSQAKEFQKKSSNLRKELDTLMCNLIEFPEKIANSKLKLALEMSSSSATNECKTWQIFTFTSKTDSLNAMLKSWCSLSFDLSSLYLPPTSASIPDQPKKAGTASSRSPEKNVSVHPLAQSTNFSPPNSRQQNLPNPMMNPSTS